MVYVTFFFVAIVKSPLYLMFDNFMCIRRCIHTRSHFVSYFTFPLILLSISDLFPVKIETKDQFNSYIKKCLNRVKIPYRLCLFVSACVRACVVDIFTPSIAICILPRWQSVTHHTKQKINQLKVSGSLYLSFSIYLCICSVRDKWSPHHLFVCLFVCWFFFLHCFRMIFKLLSNRSGGRFWMPWHGMVYEHFILFVHSREAHHWNGYNEER